MKVRFLLSLMIAICGIGGSAAAQDRPPPQITVCIVDTKAEKNPTYYGMATILTRLKCEIPGTETQLVTLGSLYQNGWRLIQVVGDGWVNPIGKQRANSPIYYMEHLGK